MRTGVRAAFASAPSLEGKAAALAEAVVSPGVRQRINTSFLR